MKRKIPLFIVIFVGFLTLIGHFVTNASIQNFVDNDSTQWFDIIAAFAVFLGSLNLMKLQIDKVVKKKKNWQYSVIAIFGFAFAIFAGFFYRGTNFITVSNIKSENIEMLANVIADETDNNADLVRKNIEYYNLGFAIPYEFQFELIDRKQFLNTSQIENKEDAFDFMLKKIQEDQINYYLNEINNNSEYFVPIKFLNYENAKDFAKEYSPYYIQVEPDGYKVRLDNVKDISRLAQDISNYKTFYFADTSDDKKYRKLKKFKYNMFKGVDKYLQGFPISNIYMTVSSANGLVSKIGDKGDCKILSKTWGSHIQTEGSLFYWMFQNIFTPLSATMFALLAFFVASASYRAFRIRNFEATLLLGSGVLLMLGRVPAGQVISGWVMLYILMLIIGVIISTFINSKKIIFTIVTLGLVLITISGLLTGFNPEILAYISLPVIQDWIFAVPTTAGARAVMIGIALGIIGTSFRIIVGLEKSFLGE
ncbi:MAG: hypothetical protein ISR90_01690 [Candidatus Marinimicrobia bacterium]|nr:hypothetical protein [Candidatus Neomarinimicrobiota bacterium]MBL7022757.1 hypothetical protein [Candidatus Neomarinimicrobiota bacterium]